jgi:hypothetical protein
VKTKAYKLAAELGLQEQPVLDWLRANGYPNARRADMIRADVAQAARKALGRQARGRSNSGRGPSSARKSHRHDTFVTEVKQAPREPTHTLPRDTAVNEVVAAAEPDGPRLTATFAELLDGHMQPEETTEQASDTVDFFPATQPLDLDRTVHDLQIDDVSKALSGVAQGRLQEELQVERAKVEGLERMLDAQRVDAERVESLMTELASLKASHNGVLLERSQHKQKLLEVADERQTLETTCAELRNELEDVRGMLNEYEDRQVDHDSVMGDLETTRRRETAWRARALELERATHAGDDFGALLRKRGLDSPENQVRVLQALLSAEKTAGALLKAIRNIDADFLEKIFDRQLRPTCADQLCNRTTRAEKRIPLRVDADKDCLVCRGHNDKRWFAQMNLECRRAGVRRLLVVGGSEATHARLRELSEGCSIDLRLLSADEDSSPARVGSRVEGCDAVVVWSGQVMDPAITAVYSDAAQTHHRIVIPVLGKTDQVIPLARATVYRLARTHIFETH